MKSSLPRVGLALCLLGLLPCFAEVPAKPKPILVRIGLVDSLFRDQPKSLVSAFIEPFRALVKAQTGFDSTIVPGESMEKLREQLADGSLDLAVFQGIEFAWQRSKDDRLRPLALAVNQNQNLHAWVMVPADAKFERFEDLCGKACGLPKFSREHCHVFAVRHCLTCAKKDPDAFFGEWLCPANAEDALDDVVDGKLDSLIVDGVALECYKRRKPKRFEKLKPLLKSETFPASVIAYRVGTKLDDKALAKFRDGLVQANKSLVSRNLMALWRLTSFDNVPEDYEETVKKIVEAYPPPGKQ